MATAIQRRRGTATQHSSFTGLAGEITIDTTNNTVIVHDGSTAGGHRLALQSEVQAAATGDITAIVAGSGLTGGAESGSATLNIGAGNGITVNSDDIAINVAYFDQTAGGTGWGANLEPSANNTYSLGSATNVWKDVFVGPGSLYVNGQQVLSDDSGTIQVSADTNQNISILTTGTGDIELTSGGDIQLKTDVVLSADKTITSSGGVKFASNINANSNSINNLDDPVAAQDAATKAYVDAQVDTADALSELSGDTDDVSEGSTNLYFTNARADARVNAVLPNTGSLTEGSNLYFTNARADARIAAASTDDLSEGSSNLYYTNARADARITAALIDEDNMSTNSATRIPSQQSVKAYVDAQVATKDALSELSGDSDDVSEGSTNLYFTNARADARIAAANTDDLSEGSSNLYHTTERVQDVVGGQIATNGSHTNITASYDDSGDGAIDLSITDSTIRGKISVTDSGGDGSLAYNNSTGVITYTGPSASEVRAHISAGTGISISSGEISSDDSAIVHDSLSGFVADEHVAHSGVTLTAGDGLSGGGDISASRSFAVDSSVVRTSGAQTVAGAKTFSDDAVFNGNVTISGSQTVVNTETLTIEDNLVVLNSGTSGAPSENAGLQVDRGSSADVFFRFNESNDKWEFTNDGSSYTALVLDTDDLSEGSTNLYFTNARADARISNNIIDEDNMASNSSSRAPSQQSVKAYVDAQVATKDALSELSGDSDDITEGSTNLFHTTARARGSVSGGTGITYDSSTGVISLTDTGYVTGVTAGTGISGGGTSGTVSVAFDGSELPDMTADVDGSADELVILDNGTSSRKLISEITLSDFNNDAGFTTNVGDITAVVAGDGLTGGATSGSATLNIGAGALIDVAADSIAVDLSELTDMTAAMASTDEFVVLDAGSQRRKAASEIGLSVFSNDSGFTTNVGDITGVTAGTGLSGGGTSGGVTLNVSGLTVSEFAGGSIQTGSESFSDSDSVLMTAAAVNDRIQAFGYTTNVGDITGVTAGTGLTGGGSSGGVTLNVDTGAVSNGASTIPTGDQVHDFVTGQGYVTSSGVTSIEVTTAEGLDGGGTITSSGTFALSLDLSELTDMTAAVDGTSDEIILLDAGAERRKRFSEIGLSVFSNDSGFTTNVGDITAVTAGSYLTGGGSSGGVTLNVDATSANTASKVVARDSSGNFSAGVITATATSARYADLAEKYSADAEYEPGTVVVFGGDEEVTQCTETGDHRVAGVVSTDPAYLMNAEANGVAVALCGRVPVKVNGPVAKGDLLVTSAQKGHAQADNKAQQGRIIGKAISAHDGEGQGVIEALINLM